MTLLCNAYKLQHLCKLFKYAAELKLNSQIHKSSVNEYHY